MQLQPRLSDDEIVVTARRCVPGQPIPYTVDASPAALDVFMQAAESCPGVFLGAFVWPDGVSALVCWPIAAAGSSSEEALKEALIFFYNGGRELVERRRLEEADHAGRA